MPTVPFKAIRHAHGGHPEEGMVVDFNQATKRAKFESAALKTVSWTDIKMIEFVKPSLNDLSDDLKKAVRQIYGIEPEDPSQDEKLSAMTEGMLFDAYCEWQGFVGWSEKLLSVIAEIRAFKTLIEE